MSRSIPISDGIGVLDDVEEAERIARLIHHEWERDNPGETLDMCRADLIAGLGPGIAIPRTFVYRRNQAIVGWASILETDLFSHRHLGPWLANMIVLPDHRGQGIARALVRHAMDYAATVSDTLYLYTDNLQTHYLSLGWRVVETLEVDGRPTVIMSWQP
ncbi:GNAT family N-acetyltransferase [Magnetovibrio sp.]|uniref:GNAT family N-acetyltransferase n=1 Tax=Magnetovibrio sp. TaxID=2024836 RepID=UPI002F940A55